MVLDVPEIMDQHFRQVQVQPVKPTFLAGLLVGQVADNPIALIHPQSVKTSCDAGL